MTQSVYRNCTTPSPPSSYLSGFTCQIVYASESLDGQLMGSFHAMCGVGVCVFQITTTTKKYSMILHAIYGHMVAGVSCDSFAILISFNFNIKLLIIAIAFWFCSVKYIFFMRFTIATYLFCFSGFFFDFSSPLSWFLTINGSFVVCFVFLCLFLIQPLFYSKYIPFFFSSHLCPNKS